MLLGRWKYSDVISYEYDCDDDSGGGGCCGASMSAACMAQMVEWEKIMMKIEYYIFVQFWKLKHSIEIYVCT